MGSNSREEQALSLLTKARNREILAVLDDADGVLSTVELAERLGPDDALASDSADSEAEFERVLVSLHHDQLPRLADAGLVEYDSEENRAVGATEPTTDAEWVATETPDEGRADAAWVEELLSRFRTTSALGGSEIGVVEGRESVIEQGRRLADEADDELFLMYESDALLEPSCLDHARDALDRGVDIYLGSQTPGVRDLARRELPEATLWEPQLDLTNAPATYPTVGRLVLVDREQVLLTLLNDPYSAELGAGAADTDSNAAVPNAANSAFDTDSADPADATAETAVIADGEENPLVVLVRELLGQRLDHLDYQSEEFRSQLPC